MTSLIINSSTSRFIRAGRSNMVWPVVVVGIFIFFNAITLPTVPNSARLVLGGFLLLTMFIGLRTYVTTTARVVFLDDRVQIMLAIYTFEAAYDTIELVQIVRLRLTPLLRIRIKSKSPARTLQFMIPGPFTPWGSLEECSARLQDEFHVKGIQVIAT
jgi:hypothetical protein